MKSWHILPLVLLVVTSGCTTRPAPPMAKPTHYFVVPVSDPALQLSGRAGAAGMQVPPELAAGGGWRPTARLAEEVARQLQLAGIPATQSGQPLELETVAPAADSVENHLQGVRQWYESVQAAADYGAQAPGYATHVIEAAIASYTIDDRSFHLSVQVKIIDLETGGIVGRARVFSATDLRADRAFADGGELFKTTFARVVRQSVRECLGQLDLPRSRALL